MEWKAFGSYFISNEGKVKRNEKELNPSIKPNRYHYICIHENGKEKKYYVHRLVLMLFKGECPNGYECDHIDRDKSNNHIDNLRWVTHSENCMNRYTTRTDITETDPKKRALIINRDNLIKRYGKLERKQGSIRVTKYNRYEARITVNKIKYSKTFDTKEEAQAFIDSKKLKCEVKI